MKAPMPLLPLCPRLAAMVVLAVLPACLAAQALRDPTRPPAASAAPQGPGETAGLDALRREKPGPVLQMIVIRDGRAHAVIDGETVQVGDRVGGGRLVLLDAARAVLETPRGRQTLQLLPDVARRPSSAAATPGNPS